MKTFIPKKCPQRSLPSVPNFTSFIQTRQLSKRSPLHAVKTNCHGAPIDVTPLKIRRKCEKYVAPSDFSARTGRPVVFNVRTIVKYIIVCPFSVFLVSFSSYLILFGATYLSGFGEYCFIPTRLLTIFIDQLLFHLYNFQFSYFIIYLKNKKNLMNS